MTTNQTPESVKGYLHLKPPFEDENGNDISGEYITLPAHREAMAKLNDRDYEAWKLGREYGKTVAVAEQHEIERQLSGQLDAAAEALAKKDAALDAYVEALEWLRFGKGRPVDVDAAIAQVKEARGV